MILDCTYPARFEDARGVEETVIRNDGQLSMTVRGVRLVGDDFDSFEPDLESAAELFTMQRGCICAYRLSWTMPLWLEVYGAPVEASLDATLLIGGPQANGAVDQETLQLELRFLSRAVRSSGKSGWFEDELLDLVRQLEAHESMRTCITCGLSDYNPVGHGLFGGLACFRDAKEAYATVTDKSGLFRVWPLMTEFVQETYHCGHYAPRAPNTGYRG